jgi:hypothetical protein
MSQQKRELADEQANEQTEEFEPADQKDIGEGALSGLQAPRSREDIDSLFSPVSKPLPQPGEQLLSSGGFAKWQTVIWREWSRCEDDVYANYLFDLIKATAFGWKLVVSVAVLGALLGALLGYLVGLVFAGEGIYIGPWDIGPMIIGPWDLSGLPPVILALMLSVTGGMIGIEGSRRFRALYFWWQGQPTASKVEKALQQALTHHPRIKQIWAEPLRRLTQQKKQQNQPDQLVAMLNSADWIDRFVAQKTLVALGGEATETLREIATDKTNPLWKMGIWLLAGIEQETSNLFAWRVNHTLCPHCLTRFDARPIDVGVGISVTYYGCRVCGQSREYFYVPQGVSAVLAASWGKMLARQDGLLLVNWWIHRALFDFDRIKIIQATDEDVERFAVQVGNDTDPFRRPRYKKMHCLVGQRCKLSENTLRILRYTFGQVKHE